MNRTLVLIAALAACSGASGRSIFTMSLPSPEGGSVEVQSPATPANIPQNLLVQSLTLPTDGIPLALSFARNVDGSLPPMPTIDTVHIGDSIALAVKAPRGNAITLVNVFEAPAPRALPSPLLEPNADGLIVITPENHRPQEGELLNPFDPRGLRPFELKEAQFTVTGIFRDKAVTATINSRLAKQGTVIDQFLVERIDRDFVILANSGRYFRLPAGKRVTIRLPDSR